jgi:hypothetical protein
MPNGEEKKRIQIDDKDLAIIGLVIIAVACIVGWKTQSAVTVVTSIVTGIAGIVTGRASAPKPPE